MRHRADAGEVHDHEHVVTGLVPHPDRTGGAIYDRQVDTATFRLIHDRLHQDPANPFALVGWIDAYGTDPAGFIQEAEIVGTGEGIVHAGRDAMNFRARDEQANHHPGEFKAVEIAGHAVAIVKVAEGLVANPRQFRDVLRFGADEFNSIALRRGGPGAW